MKQHQNLMRDILDNGTVKGDRTGTGTISKFGGMMKFNIQHGIWPIPTTREVNHEQISQELEWMIKGMISVQWLKYHKNPIWNSWAGDVTGTIGPMYGEQWRNWNAQCMTKQDWEELKDRLEADSNYDVHDGDSVMNEVKRIISEYSDEKSKTYEQGNRSGTDQFQYIVNELKNNPDSRRMCLSVWHASLLPDISMSPKDNADAGRMALAPCHSMWQVDTKELTDLEILREIYWKETFSEEDRIKVLDHIHNYSQDLFVVVVNAEMLLDRVIAPTKQPRATPLQAMDSVINHHTGVIPDEVADRHLKLTEKGEQLVKEYRANKDNPTRKLSLLCFARSQDVPLGTVYNVGEYSLLAHYLAHITNMLPWEYTHMMGDHHIYANQVEKVEEQLGRHPKRPCRISMDAMNDIVDQFDHRRIVVDYVSHPKIVFPRAAV